MEETAQIANVTFQGMNVAVNATKEGLEMAMRLLTFMATAVRRLKDVMEWGEKQGKKVKFHAITGKTNIDNLKDKGGTLSIHEFSDKRMYQLFKKNAKKWGLLYSECPNFNKKSDSVFVAFSVTEADLLKKCMEETKKEWLKEEINRRIKEGKRRSGKKDLSKHEKEEMKDCARLEVHEQFELALKSIQPEEYAEKSGMTDVSEENFEKKMQDTFGNLYIETKEDMEKTSNAKKNNCRKQDLIEILMNSKEEEMKKRMKNGASVVEVKKESIIHLDKTNKTVTVASMQAPDIEFMISTKDLIMDRDGKLSVLLDENSSFQMENIVTGKKTKIDGKEMAAYLKKYSGMKKGHSEEKEMSAEKNQETVMGTEISAKRAKR